MSHITQARPMPDPIELAGSNASGGKVDRLALSQLYAWVICWIITRVTSGLQSVKVSACQ